MTECRGSSNCKNANIACWYCTEERREFIPLTRSGPVPEEIEQRREERKAERKAKKQTPASKRSRHSRQKGYRGEVEAANILPGAERSIGKGSAPDVKWIGRKVEVKLRNEVPKTPYEYLKIEPCVKGEPLRIKQHHDASEVLLMRRDHYPWLFVMPIDPERIMLYGDEVAELADGARLVVMTERQFEELKAAAGMPCEALGSPRRGGRVGVVGFHPEDAYDPENVFGRD